MCCVFLGLLVCETYRHYPTLCSLLSSPACALWVLIRTPLQLQLPAQPMVMLVRRSPSSSVGLVPMEALQADMPTPRSKVATHSPPRNSSVALRFETLLLLSDMHGPVFMMLMLLAQYRVVAAVANGPVLHARLPIRLAPWFAKCATPTTRIRLLLKLSRRLAPSPLLQRRVAGVAFSRNVMMQLICT